MGCSNSRQLNDRPKRQKFRFIPRNLGRFRRENRNQNDSSNLVSCNILPQTEYRERNGRNADSANMVPFAEDALISVRTYDDEHNSRNNTRVCLNVYNESTDYGGLNATHYVESSSRPNSANSNYYDAEFKRPLIRQYSPKEEYRRFHFNQNSAAKVIHCSLNNIYQQTHCESPRYARFRRTNSLDRNSQLHQEVNSRWNSVKDVSEQVYGMKIKQNSFDDEYNEEQSYEHITKENNKFQRGLDLDQYDDSFVGPHVKHRAYNVYESNDSLTQNIEERHSPEVRTEHVEIESFSGTEDPDYILNILSFPSEWCSFTLDRTGYFEVLPASPEGSTLQRYFYRTSQARDYYLQITNVERIENPYLHTMYLLKKEEMEIRNGHVDELFLYHGTKRKHLDSICENNLNWRLHSESHRFGKGVSFSPRATYSCHYSDSSVLKVMLLFKVLVSNAVIGTADMIIPPDEDGAICDTSIKDDTRVIVKYSDNEFYPLYKITYNKCMCT